APGAGATSRRSVTERSAPVRAVAARSRPASARSGRPGRSFSRSWTAGSPASSAASTTATRSRSVARRSVTRTSLGSEEGIAHPHEQPEQYHAEHQAPRDELHLGRQQGLFHHEVTRGGTMPWKKIHDTASPTQTMKPKRQTTYTSPRRPMPSCPHCP